MEPKVEQLLLQGAPQTPSASGEARPPRDPDVTQVSRVWRTAKIGASRAYCRAKEAS